MNAVALVPFAVLLFILPFPGTVALRLLCLAAAFLLAVAYWRRLSPGVIPCKPAITAWAGIALLSLSYAADPAYSLGEIKNEIGYALMIFIAFFAVTRSSGQFKLWLCACLASMLVLSLWVLVARQGSGVWNDAAGHGGVGAYVSAAVLALPLVLLAWGQFEQPWQRAMLAGIALLILACAYLAHQRVFWAVFGLESAIAVALMHFNGLIKVKLPALAAWVVGFASMGLVLVTLTHEERLAAGDKVTVVMNEDSRLAHWRGISEEIMKHPLSGAGFGREAMKKAYPHLVPEQLPLWHPHNLFLTYGIGMGLPGMAALLWLFASLARQYWGHRRDPDAARRMAALVGVLLLAGLVARNLTNDFFVRDGALLFWALQGALLGYLSSPAPKRAGAA